ncbi:MAG: hypothetical protein ABEJ69_01370, partial [Candidatus Nanohaloarchaea archaeon]
PIGAETMAEKSRGSLHGARKKLSRSGSKTTISERLKEFEEGETVKVKINSSETGGRPHARFYGKTGEITGKRGDAYQVEIRDGGNTKTLFLPAIHLQKMED